MGLFSTGVTFNKDKVQIVIDNINTAKGKLADAEETLRSAIETIRGANGYNLLETEGVNLDSSLAETVGTTCSESIDNIVSTINQKEELIMAYNEADGLDKVKMFFSIKSGNIKEDFETGATIWDKGKSALANIVSMAESTGAAVFAAGSKLLDVIGGGASSVKEFLFGREKTNSEDVLETDGNISDGEMPVATPKSDKNDNDTTAETTFENGSNRSIDTTNLNANSRVGRAVSKYASEIDTADYVTINENLFTTTTTDYVNGQPVQVTHVVINDPSQINGAPANGAYASGLETASSAANRLGSKILINGSHFNYSDGSEDLKGANNISIVNGQIKKDGYSGGNELLVDSSGRIYNAYGKSAQELVNSGVKYSYSCHSTQVIENGDISPSYREGNYYKRTVIGMTEPCEYYITTDTTYNNKLSDTATYLKNKGCTNAYSLDQGGSVTLVRNNDVINNTTDGERAIGDFLYFT